MMYTDYATLMPRRPSKKPHPRVPFSKDEDIKLKELVNNYGTNWNVISEKMGNRNARQCKERWTNYLSPNVIMKPWTSEEDEFLKSKLAEFGPKWVKISSFFPNRTDIQLKNRWFVLMRKEFKHKTKTGRKKYRNLGELIVKLSKVLNLDCEKIISCCSLYFKTGNKSALKYEAKTLNNLIKKDLFDKRLDDDINEQMINHLYSISIVELCGILLEIDEFDLNHFSELFVDVFFMNGVQNLQKVDKEMKTFIGNLLKKYNSKRYEKEFILVFSLWNLKDNY